MGSTLDRVDIVLVGLDVFSEFGAVLQCDFVLRSVFVTADVNDVFVEYVAGAIEVFDKFDDTPLVLEIAGFTGAHRC